MGKYKIAYHMNIGLRGNQEDCIFVNGEIIQEDKLENVKVKAIEGDKALFAVCDGMGGHSKGEWASRFVCTKLNDNLEHFQFSKEFVQDLIGTIQKGMENEGIENNGTTIAGVALEGREAKIFNTGDSRVYKISRQDIIYLSHDHSLVQSGVDQGYISEDETFNHPQKNVIEFGIGGIFKNEWDKGDKKVNIKDDVLGADEHYLICTDGVNDVMRDNEIFDILHNNPLERCSEFIEYLNERKNDNFSFIIVGYD